MFNELNNKYGVQPHPMQLYRARRRAIEEIEGKHADSFKKIPNYARMLCEKNLGSVVKIDYWPRINMDDIPRFRRFFVYLNGCKQGFLKGCKPFIGLDGCHLEGPYRGVLLTTISLDANNNLFPIAFMVVEKENKDSWLLFSRLFA